MKVEILTDKIVSKNIIFFKRIVMMGISDVQIFELNFIDACIDVDTNTLINGSESNLED